jgi:hypothetical protein
MVNDLVYVYTNSRLMTMEKEKEYVINADLEDLDFSLEEDNEVHGDPNLDGWDDGNLGVQNLDGKTSRSSFASSKNHV